MLLAVPAKRIIPHSGVPLIVVEAVAIKIGWYCM